MCTVHTYFTAKDCIVKLKEKNLLFIMFFIYYVLFGGVLKLSLVIEPIASLTHSIPGHIRYCKGGKNFITPILLLLNYFSVISNY